jgi:hypothetical protein
MESPIRPIVHRAAEYNGLGVLENRDDPYFGSWHSDGMPVGFFSVIADAEVEIRAVNRSKVKRA